MLRKQRSPVHKSSLLSLNILVLFILVFASSQNASAKAVLDFDGDGKTDYAVNRASEDQSDIITWYISLSSGGTIIQQFGLGRPGFPGDRIVPEDYDGDGKCDIAVYRQFTGWGVLYVLESGKNAIKATVLPDFHDTLIVQDYDGDGLADVADTWHNDNDNMIWRILESKTGKLRTVYFGIFSTDDPVKGDFDGDGNGDIAVYRREPNITQSTFYVLRSSDGMLEARTFGTRFDGPITADFDGDGKTDYAVCRDDVVNGTERSMWYWIESSTGTFRSLHFGDALWEQGVPGDYDGDGRTDQAVARYEGQKLIFYVNGSLSGLTAVHWGQRFDFTLVFPFS